MSDHLRRKVEQWICAHLSAQLPGLVCVPSDGDAKLVPPYAVAVAEEDTLAGSDATGLVPVDVIWATSMFDQLAPERAGDFKRILLACSTLVKGSFQSLGLIVHGADVMGTQHIEDPQSKGDVVRLMVGATDMEIDFDTVLPPGGYRTRLGDGSARSFTVTHDLGTPALAAFLLRDAVDGGRVYVHGRDYTVTIPTTGNPAVDDNTLTIALLDLRVPANPQNPAGMATPAADALLFTVLAYLPA